MNRTEASEAIDETNATIGAAISTCSIESEFENILTRIQHELLDLSDAIRQDDHDPTPPSTEYLQQTIQRYGGQSRDRGSAVLAGLNEAAGLLKLARCGAQRAGRLTSSAAGPSGQYLEALMEVLLVVAHQLEQRDHTLMETVSV